MIAIKTLNLEKRFKGKIAVNKINLSIKQGELFSLLGENGAGKTTAIKMLSCLCRPSSGDAFILGHSVVKSPLAVKKKIGISPQETAVAPNLTVIENLQLMAELHGESRKTAVERTWEMIGIFDLREVVKKRAKILSGGWQRRLSIAMAFISRPRVLFLDEPTLGFDVIARRALWGLIRNLKGKTTIILTTHYLEEAAALSDRIGIMAEGKLKALGTMGEIMDCTGTPNLEEAFIALAAKGGHQG